MQNILHYNYYNDLINDSGWSTFLYELHETMR